MSLLMQNELAIEGRLNIFLGDLIFSLVSRKSTQLHIKLSADFLRCSNQSNLGLFVVEQLFNCL